MRRLRFCSMVLAAAMLCAGCAARTITSDPSGARIYAGPSPDRMYRSAASTPATSPRVFQWPRYCFQVRKPGFRDSDIRCVAETYFDQRVHFVLDPLSTARPAPRPVFRPASRRRASARPGATTAEAVGPAARGEEAGASAQQQALGSREEILGGEAPKTGEEEAELFSSAAAAVGTERGRAALQSAVDALRELASVAGLEMNYGDYLRHLSLARTRLDDVAGMSGEVPQPALAALRSAVGLYEEALTVWNYRRGLPKELRSGGLPVPYAASDERVASWVERCPDAKAAPPEGSLAQQAWVPDRVLECLWKLAQGKVNEAQTAMAGGT